jgi:hypothetical protein
MEWLACSVQLRSCIGNEPFEVETFGGPFQTPLKYLLKMASPYEIGVWMAEESVHKSLRDSKNIYESDLNKVDMF